MYHTACLLHLIAHPTPPSSRPIAYSPSLCTSALKYSRLIVSNSIANRAAASWANAAALLTLGGQCLTEWRERKACLQVLRDIRRLTGWNTRSNVAVLLESWDWIGETLVECDQAVTSVSEQMRKVFGGSA